MVSFPLQHRATPLTSTSLSLKISTHVVLKIDPGTADDIDFIPDDWFFWFLWKQKKDKNHSNVKKRRNEQKIVNKNKNKAERIKAEGRNEILENIVFLILTPWYSEQRTSESFSNFVT